MSEPMLPPELVWGEGGHVSDVVLTTLGDGQEALVPREARAHVDGCAACTAALGHGALLALYTHDRLVAAKAAGLLEPRTKALASPTRPPEQVEAPFRVPYRALVFAFALALLGSVPGIVSAPDDVASGRAYVQRNLHVFMHHLTTSARASHDAASQAALVLTFGSAACLTLLALLVARSRSRPGASHAPL